MTLDQMIEFYKRQYETAKIDRLALVAFGAYMALMQLRASTPHSRP